ncbi:hypothetical protein A9Q81_26600 [Gammaproteobacteria bacterium 42_54_T18]|nr:hypothetical protein A9Q81_26600 [Gammaproteobacteria bacterium 42_54_T18]
MENEKQYFFDNPQNIKRLLNCFYGICAILVVLDFVIHRHVAHSWESLWGFYPIYGFVGCVVLVLVATWMRTFLMRDEDYYDSKVDCTEGSDHKGKLDANEKLNGELSQKNKPNLGGHDVDA